MKKKDDERDWFDTILWIRKMKAGDIGRTMAVLLFILAAAVCVRGFFFPVS